MTSFHSFTIGIARRSFGRETPRPASPGLHITSRLFIYFILFSFCNFPALAASGGGTPVVCCGPCPYGPNLVVNGNFGSTTNCGYYNFTSDLTFYCGGMSPAFGSFTLTTNASLINPAWTGTSHTADGSQVLFGRSDSVLKKTWYQNVSVVAGEKYCYSAWFRGGCMGCVPTDSPTLQLAINTGTSIIILDTKKSATWLELCGNYIAPTTGTVELIVYVMGRAPGSRPYQYFNIDDIGFRKIIPPIAKFTYTDTACNQPTLFTSVDQTAGLTHYWDFGDGYTSSAVNPAHTYTTGGTYTVRHTVCNPCICVLEEKQITISCCCTPCNNYIKNGDFSDTGCFVNYNTDMSKVPCGSTNLNGAGHISETKYARLWNANWRGMDHSPGGTSKFMLIDGPYSTDTRVWYKNVKVTKDKKYCFVAYVKNASAVENIHPGFRLEIMAGTTVTVLKTVLDIAVDTVNWTKLCGTFTAPSTDSIELRVVMLGKSGGGNDALLDDITFGDNQKPDSNFTFSNQDCSKPAMFHSVDIGDNTLHQWDFGDGTTVSNEVHPVHNFPKTGGTFTVRHIVTNGCGTDTMIQQITVPNCCCCATACQTNLVTNGDFSYPCSSSAPTSYSSGLSWITCSNSGGNLGGAGHYTETTNASGWGGWHGKDHTGNGSKIMIIDGPTTKDTFVWRQTVTVKPGHKYCFSAFVKAANNTAGPSFILKVNGSGIGYTALDSAISIIDTVNWTKLCGQYTVPAGVTQLTLSIIMKKGPSVGNDGMLDDISFTEPTMDPEFTYSAAHCNEAMPFSPAQKSCVTHLWKFGDGTTSTSASPAHTFPQGTYTITHIVSNACATDSVKKTITVNCCCGICHQSLVNNGDFSSSCGSSAPTSYLSGLTWVSCGTSGNLGGAGHYTETTSPSGWGSGWQGSDHSGNGSKVLLLDGPTSADTFVWRQTVIVKPGHTYCFAAYVKAANSSSDGSSFLLKVSGTGIGPHLLDSAIGLTDPSVWSKLCGSYTIPSGATQITLSIIMKKGASIGNDAMVDDISFNEQSPPSAFFNSSAAHCNENVPFVAYSDDVNETHLWKFGDGTTASGKFPTHVFAQGTYTVTHIISNSCGIDSMKRTIVINCCCNPCMNSVVQNGDFSATCGASAPTMYTSGLGWKTCGSTGNLGGNDHYTETDNPNGWGSFIGSDHTGNSSKVLLLDGPMSSDTFVWRQTVTVKPGKQYCFSAYAKSASNYPTGPSFLLKISGTNFLPTILDSAVNLVDLIKWSKLCGTFTVPANTYSVTLSIIMRKGPYAGNDGMIDDIILSEQSRPGAKFSYSEPTCSSPVQFTETDAGTYITQFWRFDDGTTSSADNPSHSFPLPRRYYVMHRASNACGTDSMKRILYVKCCCSPCSTNLVRNGSFSDTACRSRYNSDLLLHDCGDIGGSLNSGSGGYSEVTDANLWYPGSIPGWHGKDHTGLNGSKLMIIDGPVGNDKRIWYQTVNVEKGRTYCFSAYVKTICGVCGNPPSYNLRVGGMCESSQLDTLNNVFDSTAWAKLCGTYTATSSGPVELDIVMKGAPDYSGNDGALDDISFAETCCGINISADFKVSGCPECGTAVQFTSKNSTGNHSWDFGDGYTSTSASPSHIFYLTTNNYIIVTHTVTSGCKTETKTMKIYIDKCSN